jgi:purine-cytosine permease-like protein
MGKIGFAVPALVMVVFSTITTGFPDVYSAACSTLNISQRFSSKSIVWVAGIISILVALVFPMEQYENFLFLIGAMFVPLFGVVLTDYFFMRDRRISTQNLYRPEGEYWYRRISTQNLYRPEGEYWYAKGFNVIALICWAIGFFVYELIALMKYPIGGSMPSLFVAGACYYFITRRRKKRIR